MSRLLLLLEKEDEDHIDEKTQIGDKNKINCKELRDSPKERLVGVQGWAASGHLSRLAWLGLHEGPGVHVTDWRLANPFRAHLSPNCGAGKDRPAGSWSHAGLQPRLEQRAAAEMASGCGTLISADEENPDLHR